MSAKLLISALLGGALAFVAGVGGPGLAIDAPLPSPLHIGVSDAGAPEIDLVVLGDSYASAATPFDRGTLNLLGAPSVCARGPAWPRLLRPRAVRLSLMHVSCSGAVIPDLLDRRSRAGEPVQVHALSGGTDLVMLAIGGNDTGFSDVFSACRFDPPERCAEVAARVAPRVDALAGGPGYAVDAGLRVSRELAPGWRATGGVRWLDGGADNDEVYSFATFTSVTLGVAWRPR